MGSPLKSWRTRCGRIPRIRADGLAEPSTLRDGPGAERFREAERALASASRRGHELRLHLRKPGWRRQSRVLLKAAAGANLLRSQSSSARDSLLLNIPPLYSL